MEFGKLKRNFFPHIHSTQIQTQNPLRSVHRLLNFALLFGRICYLCVWRCVMFRDVVEPETIKRLLSGFPVRSPNHFVSLSRSFISSEKCDFNKLMLFHKICYVQNRIFPKIPLEIPKQSQSKIYQSKNLVRMW